MNFNEKYKEARGLREGSILCAGLDPAEFGMGRGEKGLAEGTVKKDWALQYVEAVAPFASALKINTNYWEDAGDVESLREIVELAKYNGMVVIEDSKRRDIGPTNDAGLFYTQRNGYDAATFSPFAGNLEEAAKQAHERGLGLISMCIMSNPEFEKVKNSWVEMVEPIALKNETNGDYIEKMYDLFWQLVDKRDRIKISGSNHIRNYLDLAFRAQAMGTDGIVIGAPSGKNHIKEFEIENVSRVYNGLILVPGIGAQGGELILLRKYFDKGRLMVNVGRELMFPNGLRSTPQDQCEAASKYSKLF